MREIYPGRRYRHFKGNLYQVVLLARHSETGERMVPSNVLCALADFYGVSVDYILGRTDKREALK